MNNPACAIFPLIPPNVNIVTSSIGRLQMSEESNPQIRTNTTGLFGINSFAIWNIGNLHSSRLSSARMAACNTGKSPMYSKRVS